MSLTQEFKLWLQPHRLSSIPSWLIAKPYPIFHTIRKKIPVHYLRTENCWLITRYKDCDFILKNTADFSSAFFQSLGNTMIALDPPQHSLSRKPFSPIFKRTHIAQWSNKIQDVAQEYIDKLKKQKSFELYHDLAEPYAHQCAGDFLGIKHGHAEEMLRLAYQMSDHKQKQENMPTCADFIPNLTQDGFMMQSFINHPDWSDEDKLNNIFFFILAGLQSIVQAVANTLYILSKYSDQWEQTFDTPQQIPNIVQECLRLETVVYSLPRVATKNITLNRLEIQSGDIVKVCLSAANRDPEVFQYPDQFLLNRQGCQPLIYGAGIHKCLGIHLGNTILEGLLEVIQEQKLYIQKIKSSRLKLQGQDPFIRGVKAMQVKFHKSL